MKDLKTASEKLAKKLIAFFLYNKQDSRETKLKIWPLLYGSEACDRNKELDSNIEIIRIERTGGVVGKERTEIK